MLDQDTSTNDTPGNVVALRTQQFTDEQALAWLQERVRITAPASRLARIWGWHERRTRRKLESRERAGVIRRRRKSIRVVASKSDTPILPKRTANGHAQTKQADAARRISYTSRDLKSDTPTLADRTVGAKAASEVKLREPSPEVAPLVPLPPLRVAHRIVPKFGRRFTRVDYLSARGRLLALGLAAVGVITNATFGASMGSTAWQQML